MDEHGHRKSALRQLQLESADAPAVWEERCFVDTRASQSIKRQRIFQRHQPREALVVVRRNTDRKVAGRLEEINSRMFVIELKTGHIVYVENLEAGGEGFRADCGRVVIRRLFDK